jgi:hypothetical protein
MKLLINVQERFKNVKRIFSNCKQLKMKMITKQKVKICKWSSDEYIKIISNLTSRSNKKFEKLIDEYG